MTHYRAPLEDYRFLLDELIPTLVPGSEADGWSASGALLESAARLCENVLEPLNRSGDESGCRYEHGSVSTPGGFREAYAVVRECGWMNVSEGDSGIATSAAFCFDETVAGANVAFSNYLGPTKRVVQALSQLLDAQLQARYVQPLLTGHCGGTLCLTEPECGTDLGLISTRAEPGTAPGEYLLSGNKIFVTSGEHDLTENIVHLVLARIAGAPAGVKGLSLFLVPKLRQSSDGSSLESNGVQCTGIEHKMGVRASATCTLRFERARGLLLGSAGGGLRAIFPIMERERLSIALQSVGLAEHAYQKARSYARDRLQGRSARGARFTHLAADPIIVHADVRRMLLTMKAYTGGARALLLWTAGHLDLARRTTDSEKQRDALDFVQLVTPMVKAFVTDVSAATTNLGIQVMGGHGYIRESGMEQLARDARVTQLYAGANGIQALDLVARKLPARGGRMLELFTRSVDSAMASWPRNSAVAPLASAVHDGLGKLQATTDYLQQESARDPDLAGSAGYAYLELFGYVALGFLWTHAAVVASERLSTPDGSHSKEFYEAKIATAQFYVQHLLPSIERSARSVLAGSDVLMQLDQDAF